MNPIELIRWVGISHALQPPLTWLLASPRGLDLANSLRAGSRLGGAIAHNMAIASVSLPTSLGLLLAWRAPDALAPGTTRDLALLLAAFWSWRLYRQLSVLGPAWPQPKRGLHLLLLSIFVVQGPVLGGLVLRPDNVDSSSNTKGYLYRSPRDPHPPVRGFTIQQASATGPVAGQAE